MHQIDFYSSDNALSSLVVDGSYTFGAIVANILEKETSHTKQQPLPQKIRITVFIISQAIHLEVKSSDTLDTILSMIRDKEVIRTPDRVVAFHKLHPHSLPFEHSLKDDQFYYVTWKSAPASTTELIEILVKDYREENTIPIKVKRSDTIADVKECIYRTGGIKPFMQKLYFAGMLLKDDVALTDYNIHGDITLDLLLKECGKMRIYSETINGKVSLKVTPNSTIREVKSLIRKEAKLSLDQSLNLVYAGQRLSDFYTLSDYDVQKNAVLCLMDADDKPMSRIEIHVNIFSPRKTISLQVRKSDTIHHVKTMIQKVGGILARKQILYLLQMRLRNGSTLAEYHIKDQSTLNLLVYTHEMELYEDGLADRGLLGMGS